MFKNKPAIKFNSSRLSYRLVEYYDVDDLFEICSDSNVTTFLTFMPHQNVTQTKNVIANMAKAYFNAESVNFAIVEKNTNKTIGSMSLTFNHVENGADIGYLLNYKYWNKGYMSEAIKMLIKVAFEYYNLSYLSAKHISDNQASKKILLKNNFTYDFTSNDSISKNGQKLSLDHYHLLP